MKLPQTTWVKASLHTHTTKSDGRLDPERVVEFYGSAGYQIVSITDHNKVTSVPHSKVVTITGIEVDVGSEKTASRYHVVILGLSEPPPQEARRSITDLLDWSRENDCFAFIAHPYWSMLSGNDLITVKGYHGIEVYNHGCEVEISRGYSGSHWDYALSNGVFSYGLAVDDVHRYTVDALGGWVKIDADNLDPDSILKALMKGKFYASSGVIVKSFEFSENLARVKMDGALAVKMLSGNTRGAYLSVKMLKQLVSSGEKQVEAELWEDGFRIMFEELRVEGKLENGRFTELEIKGALPVKNFLRLELIGDTDSVAWLNPVKV
ncbi:MAG: hypothetical protein QW291_04105 [Thermofilaceae archaeon]